MDVIEKSELKGLVSGILERGYLLSLATSDAAGPWVCEILYTSDAELCIYWLSDANSRHSKAIDLNSAVAASINLSDRQGMPTEAVQISGTVEVLEGDNLDLATKRSKKLNLPLPKAIGETLVYNNQRYGGDHCWYKLTPKKVDILLKSRFGDNKVFLEL